jgi:hypothetical protein
MQRIGLPYQILRPSVIGGKMLSEENNNFISNIWFFIFWQNFILPHKEEVNRKMYVHN